MAKIIYKEGCEGQNKLSSIEGIEIDLLNGQKALIYPKYAERSLLISKAILNWDFKIEREIEALKVEDTRGRTESLLKIGSPAAEWVSQFKSDHYGAFCMPSMIAAMEIQDQKVEIDDIAETIEGADLMEGTGQMDDFISTIGTCSRSNNYYCWSILRGSRTDYHSLLDSFLVVPIILYR